MLRAFLFLAAALMSGCSDGYLNRAEQGVPVSRSRGQSLSDLSTTAGQLADGYVTAAQKTQRAQDALGFVTVTAAAAAVGGSVADAAKTDIAGAALVGTAAQQTAARFHSRPAIVAILDGAKRMNCVAAVADYGTLMLTDGGENQAGVIATIWAIYQVRIMTRDKLTREPAQFSTLFNDFKTNVGAALSQGQRTRALAIASTGVDFGSGTKLALYLDMIDKCTASDQAGKPPGAQAPGSN